MPDLDRAKALFEAGLALAQADRPAFLSQESGGDRELELLVLAMLAEHANSEGLHGAGEESPPVRPIHRNPPTGSHANLGERPVGALVPERIGSYRILREVGRGGMGSVLAAVRDDDQLKLKVAIKLIKRGLDTEELLRRFELEKQLLSSLNHPNIARVLDAGVTHDDQPYFVMEYIEGQPIDEYCDFNQLSVRERLSLFQKVCAAASAAHQALIVHRDLKPGNILVTPDGEPHLVDFGIAKFLSPSVAGRALMTSPHFQPMTPEYASPEQVLGKPIQTTSDVYSLGVLLYELLTGSRPYNFERYAREEFERILSTVEPEKPSIASTKPATVLRGDGTTVTVSAEQRAKTRNVKPATLRRALLGDLDSIVLMAMRKSPKRRYQSAEALGADIENHLRGRPVVARPETWTYLLGRFAVRNKGPVLAAAMITLVLAGGLATTLWQKERAESATRLAMQQKDRAEASEKLARTFADGVLAAVPEIAPLRNSLPVADKLLEAAKAYVDELEKQGPVSPDRVVQIADVLRVWGEAQGGATAKSRGQLAVAAESMSHAKDILDRAAASGHPGSTEQRGYVSICIALANVRGRLGQTVERRALADTAVEVARRLNTGSSPDIQDQRSLGLALVALGDVQLETGDTESAAASYAEAVHVREALHASGSRAPRGSAEDLGVALGKVGKADLELARADQAAKYFERALQIREQVAAEPANTTSQRRIALSLRDLADARLVQGRAADALLLAERRERLTSEILSLEPEVARAYLDAAESSRLLAAVAAARGTSEERTRWARTYAERTAEAVRRWPDDLAAAAHQASAALELGLALGTDTAQLSRAYQLAVEVARRDPGVFDNIRRVIDAAIAYADVLKGTGDSAAAAATLSGASDLLGDLARRNLLAPASSKLLDRLPKAQ